MNQRIEKLENKISDRWSNFDLDGVHQTIDRLIRLNPQRAESWIFLAKLTDQTDDIVVRDSACRQIIELTPENHPQIHLLYAKSLWSQGKYQEASIVLSRYHQWKTLSTEIYREYDRISKSVYFAKQQIEHPQQTNIERISGEVNTQADEYFPSLTVDGNMLVFTRQGKELDGKAGTLLDEQLFAASWLNSSYTAVKDLGPTINTAGNEGTQTLRQDGRWMIYTACNRHDTKGGCDLYLSVRTGNVWSPGVNLGYPVNTRYWESTPTIAPDGKGLIFSSNRPGGMGGMDLWYTSLQDGGGWSTPINLGEPVNTDKDEMAPFLHSDGVSLFFSSNGHTGMGGFDLYLSHFFSVDSIAEPDNLGYPINTFHNEDGISMDGKGKRVIISTNRESLYGRDLFMIDLPERCRPNSVMAIKGTVKDGVTGTPLGANVKISDFYSSYNSMVDSDPSSGQFLVGVPYIDSLRLSVQKEGYLFYSSVFEAVNTQSLPDDGLTILLMPIQNGATTILRNIFFEFDSAVILPESYPELSDLVSLLKRNPSLHVEISGHTDSVGSSEYNLSLSQKRAESICNYLISKGCNPDRLTAHGYGEMKPMAKNDTEEGRKMNRRTQVLILSGR